MTAEATCVLVINAGSSSLKYQLIDLAAETTLASGLIERIGEGGSSLTHTSGEQRHQDQGVPCDSHQDAFVLALDGFAQHGPALADHPLLAVGHRVVHGGTRFSAPTLVTDELIAVVTELIPLAPLHNPANLEGIKVAREVFPDTPQVAVFDTAFHQSIPDYAYTYAVPRAWREDLGVRRYGFHGTSHAYVSRAAAGLLDRPVDDVKLVVLHIGNGASASAVAGGRCIDTSMGMTPLEGLVMGTRPGDLDPGLAGYLLTAGLSPQDYDHALNKESGLKGLSGSNDNRDVGAGVLAGEPDAILARGVTAYRIKKYVGAYAFALGGLDAVVFTAGAGENDAALRAQSLAGLEHFGIVVDPQRNAAPSRTARFVSPDGAPVAVLVVPTDEELEIARQAAQVVAET